MSEKFEFNRPVNKALPDPKKHLYKQYKVPSDQVLAAFKPGEWLSTPAICGRLEGVTKTELVFQLRDLWLERGRLRRRVVKSRVEWSLR